ncbi:MAG: hypothetical protein IPN69_17705 [Acidobacteria bacterium]|nr:hypothetical protein [Acidobacteriota bacterium]
MQYTKISEIYDANDQIRLKLKAVIGDLTEAQAGTRENDEGWTIREIVEHLAIVGRRYDEDMCRLLAGGAEKGCESRRRRKDLGGVSREKTSAWGHQKVKRRNACIRPAQSRSPNRSPHSTKTAFA